MGAARTADATVARARGLAVAGSAVGAAWNAPVVGVQRVGELAVLHEVDGLLVRTPILDRARVHHVVQGDVALVDGRSHRTQGLHVGVAHPRAVRARKARLPKHLLELPVVIVLGTASQIAFVYRSDLHEGLGIGAHVVERLCTRGESLRVSGVEAVGRSGELVRVVSSDRRVELLAILHRGKASSGKRPALLYVAVLLSVRVGSAREIRRELIRVGRWRKSHAPAVGVPAVGSAAISAGSGSCPVGAAVGPALRAGTERKPAARQRPAAELALRRPHGKGRLVAHARQLRTDQLLQEPTQKALEGVEIWVLKTEPTTGPEQRPQRCQRVLPSEALVSVAGILRIGRIRANDAHFGPPVSM